jgi:hypothetical protein
MSLSIAVAAGLFGGALIARLVTPVPAFAQVQADAIPNRAQGFTLVDPQNRIVGTF